MVRGDRTFGLRPAIPYTGHMSQLLEEAIETLRELPEDEQDAAEDALFVFISSDERHYRRFRPERGKQARLQEDREG